MSADRNLTWLVARREVRERAKARSFTVSTLLLLVAVAVGVVLPALLSSKPAPMHVGLVGRQPAAGDVVHQAARLTGVTAAVVHEPDLLTARRDLHDGRVAVVFVPGHEVLLERLPSSTDRSSASYLVASALAELDGERALLAKLPPQVAASVEKGASLPVRGLAHSTPGPSLRAELTGFVAAILIYSLLLSYGMRLSTSAHEEKASRVVEVVLAAVRPSQLLLGKVLGTGLLFGAQILAMLVVALGAGEASGSPVVQGGAPGVIAVAAVCLVVGYAFYCTAFAAAGAMVTRQADLFNVTLPLQIPLFLGYIAADTSTFAGTSLFGKVLAFLPPTAPVVDPALYASGDLALWQFLVSAAICAAGVAAVAWLASVVYARSVLQAGPRVRLRAILARQTA